jgi:hypothetical protein
MADLNEMQFEILPFADADEGIPFGIGLDVSCDAEGFKPGGPDWYTEDGENPINGATAFGRDHLTSTTWQWDLHVNRDRTSTAVESLGVLSSAWRAPEVREVVGAVTAIRYRLAGRDRRIYGRPRRFEYSPSNLILGGLIPISADFKTADCLHYDDEESNLVMSLQISSSGGTILPAVLPITTLPPGDGGDQAVVGGDADTYPVIRFEGPITNPSIECEAWALSLGGTGTVPTFTLAEGEYVEIDTRPWAQTVLFNGDTSVAGALGSRQWLSRMKLPPGRTEFAFHGAASSSGGTCEVRWRSAWNSL